MWYIHYSHNGIYLAIKGNEVSICAVTLYDVIIQSVQSSNSTVSRLMSTKFLLGGGDDENILPLDTSDSCTTLEIH